MATAQHSSGVRLPHPAVVLSGPKGPCKQVPHEPDLLRYRTRTVIMSWSITLREDGSRPPEPFGTQTRRKEPVGMIALWSGGFLRLVLLCSDDE